MSSCNNPTNTDQQRIQFLATC